MRNVTEIQRRLIELGFLAPGGDDGIFGEGSLAAYNHFLASKGKPPHVGLILLAELNRELFPEEQPSPKPKPIRKPGLFELLASIKTIFDISKGKTMTSDQIAGVVRTLVAALAAYFAGKGWFGGNVSPELITAITTVIVGAWSWFSKRPKVIEPIKK